MAKCGFYSQSRDGHFGNTIQNVVLKIYSPVKLLYFLRFLILGTSVLNFMLFYHFKLFGDKYMMYVLCNKAPNYIYLITTH